MPWLGGSLLAAAMIAGFTAVGNAQSQASQPEVMPSGQFITPLAPTGAVFSKLNPGLKDFPGYTVRPGGQDSDQPRWKYAAGSYQRL